MKVCPVCQRCFEDEIQSCSQANHDSLHESRWGSCELIPNYRLERLHESSAAGDTFYAINLLDDEQCLVRVIPSELFGNDPNLRDDFLHETQDLLAIAHPNIARVFERGMLADGSVYVVTQWFAERTLRDWLTNENVSEIAALTIAGQVAEALSVIDSLGVWHRNIRPENIVLTDGAAKIQNIDFGGIRQKTAENPSDFQYFSPEQCRKTKVDAQTDVYALGIVLYEMLTGNPPFVADELDAIIDQHLNQNPPPFEIEDYKIRALLVHTLTESLEKPKRLRIKNANVFARRLRYIEQIANKSDVTSRLVSLPKMELPDEVLASLPTDELPELESVVGEYFSEPSRLESSIEWEQPDAIPLLNKTIDEFLEPEFLEQSVGVAYLPEIAVQSKSWRPKALIAAAGACVLLVLGTVGMWLNQSRLPDESAVKAVETVQNRVESVVEEQTETVENVEQQISPTRITEQNRIAEVARRPIQKPVVKPVREKCRCDENRVAEASNTRKVLVVTNAELNKSTEISIFNRPRLVMNPRFEKNGN